MDGPTLFLINSALPLVVVAILLAYRRYQVTWPGFAWWTAGTAGLAAGYLILVFRPWLPPLLAIILNHACFVLMALLRLEGVRRFLGRRSLLFPGILFLTAELAFTLYFYLLVDLVFARTAVQMLALTVLCLMMAAPLWRHRPDSSSVPYKLLAVTQGSYAGVMLVRAIYILTTTPSSTTVESPFLAAVFLCEVATGVSFLMVQGRRLEENLLAAQSDLQASVLSLERAIQQVRTLTGLLPICSGCKKIRDDRGQWSAVETYIRNHSEAQFTHGLCPDCMSSLFDERSAHS